MPNHQGDAVNREASRAGQAARDAAENAKINAENAEAARKVKR
jgi:hypothetical protein